MDRSSWLAERRKGIGGSDAAAIIGLSRYKTPYVVWADKTGRLPDKEDTEAMRQGRDLEDYVSRRFMEETEKKVRRHNQIIKSELYPFALANIDREVVRESAGLECKTTSVLNLKRFKNGEFPEEYYCQCVHYMAVTEYTKWYLAVLVLNQAFMVYEIERDEDEIRALMDAEKTFWETYVLTDTPPPADGKMPTSMALNYIFSELTEEEIDIPDARSDLLRLESIHKQINLLKEDAELIRQHIKTQMGGASKAYCDEYQIVWSNRQRAYIDNALLLKYCPKSIISKTIKVKVYKSFRIKKG